MDDKEYKKFGDLDIDWDLLEEDLYISQIKLNEHSNIKECLYKGKIVELGEFLFVDSLTKRRVKIKDVSELVDSNEIFILKDEFERFEKLRKEQEKLLEMGYDG